MRSLGSLARKTILVAGGRIVPLRVWSLRGESATVDKYPYGTPRKFGGSEEGYGLKWRLHLCPSDARFNRGWRHSHMRQFLAAFIPLKTDRRLALAASRAR